MISFVELAKYTILPEFRDMALEIPNRNHEIETKDRNLRLDPNEWLLPIGLKCPELEKEYLSKVRTNDKASLEGQEEALSQIYDSWRAIVDEARTALARRTQ